MQFAIVQFGAARGSPLFAFAGCAEDRVSGSVQSFFGVVPIENLNGLKFQLARSRRCTSGPYDGRQMIV